MTPQFLTLFGAFILFFDGYSLFLPDFCCSLNRFVISCENDPSGYIHVECRRWVHIRFLLRTTKAGTWKCIHLVLQGSNDSSCSEDSSKMLHREASWCSHHRYNLSAASTGQATYSPLGTTNTAPYDWANQISLQRFSAVLVLQDYQVATMLPNASQRCMYLIKVFHESLSEQDADRHARDLSEVIKITINFSIYDLEVALKRAEASSSARTAPFW